MSKSQGQEGSKEFFRRFGARLREARKAAGWTQQALANALSVDASAIARYEIGDNAPTLERAVAIARLLQVSLDFLCGLSEAGLSDHPDPPKTGSI
jgi:transcriptional regulator with XRE-family HTH domain